MIGLTSFFIHLQINADDSWERSQKYRSCSQHGERLSSEAELSSGSARHGSVKVSDAIEAQLLKQPVESSSQSASFHHEDTYLYVI